MINFSTGTQISQVRRHHHSSLSSHSLSQRHRTLVPCEAGKERWIPAGAAILFYCVALSMVAVGSAELDSSGFISMAALDCSNMTTPSSSRKLVGLPVPAGACPVRFDRMHSYGAVTSSCRGRHMTAARCCAAFKAFACPYSNLMNDISNGCADEMFFQIIVRGRLPPGLFSSICREGPEGLKC